MIQIPFTFPTAKYTSMVYVYGFCDPNAVYSTAISNIFRTTAYPSKKPLLKFIRHCKIPATGSIQIAVCFIKSYLLTKHNSMTTAYIMHTTIMCDKIRTLTPLCSD
jgi:hypothetical protein